MTKSKFFALGCLVFSFSSVPLIHADTNSSNAAVDVHRIASVEITEVTEPQGDQYSSPLLTPLSGSIPVKITIGGAPGGGGGVLGELGQIVNIGKTIWDIVEANRPVANVSTNVASAIPSSVKDWTDLQGWQAPQTKLYNVAYKDDVGITLVSFNFRIIYTSGGNVNGVGQFLSGVTIVPANITVDWGMKFAADVKVVNVANVGSSADPIAAMQLQIHWTVDSIVDHVETTKDFYIRGDGQFEQMN